jgi:hypothetical protein
LSARVAPAPSGEHDRFERIARELEAVSVPDVE